MTPCGNSRDVQLFKERLLNMNPSSQESIWVQHILWTRTTSLSQTCMKHEHLNKIMVKRRKITVLADQSVSVGHKSTLIVFLKTSVDGEMEAGWMAFHWTRFSWIFCVLLIWRNSLWGNKSLPGLHQRPEKSCTNDRCWTELENLTWHDIMIMYSGQPTVDASRPEEVMEVKGEQWRADRTPITDCSVHIYERENMKVLYNHSKQSTDRDHDNARFRDEVTSGWRRGPPWVQWIQGNRRLKHS